MVDGNWLSKINRPNPTFRKWTDYKRCKFCGASVIWVELANGKHVKLDSAPVPHGQYARTDKGIAYRPPVKHPHHGRWNWHDCANKPVKP